MRVVPVTWSWAVGELVLIPTRLLEVSTVKILDELIFLTEKAEVELVLF